MKHKSPTFGDLGTTRDPLLFCPSCRHVGKPLASKGNRHKCANCIKTMTAVTPAEPLGD